MDPSNKEIFCLGTFHEIQKSYIHTGADSPNGGNSDDAHCVLVSLRHLECEQWQPDRCISGALARKQWMGILNATRLLNASTRTLSKEKQNRAKLIVNIHRNGR